MASWKDLEGNVRKAAASIWGQQFKSELIDGRQIDAYADLGENHSVAIEVTEKKDINKIQEDLNKLIHVRKCKLSMCSLRMGVLSRPLLLAISGRARWTAGEALTKRHPIGRLTLPHNRLTTKIATAPGRRAGDKLARSAEPKKHGPAVGSGLWTRWTTALENSDFACATPCFGSNVLGRFAKGAPPEVLDRMTTDLTDLPRVAWVPDIGQPRDRGCALERRRVLTHPRIP